MLVGNIASTNYLSSANHTRDKAGNDVKAAKRVSLAYEDAYIPSQNGGKAKDINEVKKRVETGYYNTVEVDNDLTELFSNVFKKAFPS